mmetsp:Transcript_131397/g.420395  ORF Transcript_131397/g.420395 Transcript_131397/m.420395 type:complete len:100 (-) Transcript_131397:468-767(-)
MHSFLDAGRCCVPSSMSWSSCSCSTSSAGRHGQLCHAAQHPSRQCDHSRASFGGMNFGGAFLMNVFVFPLPRWCGSLAAGIHEDSASVGHRATLWLVFV